MYIIRPFYSRALGRHDVAPVCMASVPLHSLRYLQDCGICTILVYIPLTLEGLLSGPFPRTSILQSPTRINATMGDDMD
jgi:hypothetical protein